MHSLADDIQCCFSFDKDASIDIIENKTQAFLLHLKHWMTCNFLKLNVRKIIVIKVLSNCDAVSIIISDIQINGSCSTPTPNPFVKSLLVLFDDILNLEKHINGVVCTCYASLRNLGRIASKLLKTLKVQLLHYLTLSRIDYCNSLFYNLPEYLSHK